MVGGPGAGAAGKKKKVVVQSKKLVIYKRDRNRRLLKSEEVSNAWLRQYLGHAVSLGFGYSRSRRIVTPMVAWRERYPSISFRTIESIYGRACGLNRTRLRGRAETITAFLALCLCGKAERGVVVNCFGESPWGGWERQRSCSVRRNFAQFYIIQHAFDLQRINCGSDLYIYLP